MLIGLFVLAFSNCKKDNLSTSDFATGLNITNADYLAISQSNIKNAIAGANKLYKIIRDGNNLSTEEVKYVNSSGQNIDNEASKLIVDAPGIILLPSERSLRKESLL